MPDVVKGFAFRAGGRGRSMTSPEWFDGKTRRFRAGNDFSCSVTSFRSRLYTHAWRRNMECFSQVVEGDLVFRAEKKNGSVK